MEYLVDLEAFHGPMDLLLYLVEKNQVDIYDIPIAVISEQYLEFLQSGGDIDIDRLGEFLLMASYLLSLKSRLLLPGNIAEDEQMGEAIDPRRELVEKLLAYRQFKQAAAWLQERQNAAVERIYYREQQLEEVIREELMVDLGSLIRAYRAVLRDLDENDVCYELPGGDVSVSEKMEEILARLSACPDGLVFQDLFYATVRLREALALFLALLELIRLQWVEAVQGNPFSGIEIKLLNTSYDIRLK